MRFLKQFLLVAAVSFAGGVGVQALGWNAPLTLVAGIVAAALALAAYAWVVRRTERREPTEVSLKIVAGALGRGVLVGLAMFGAVILNIAFLGGYEVRGWGSVSGMIAIFGFMVAVAVTEELMYRGVVFRIVEEYLGTWLSLVLSGLVFGFAHIFNPNATVWSSLAIAIEAGLMLGAAYVATRNLWVPIGVHFAWNFAQGGIFSTSVSGQDAPQGLLDGVTSGSALVTGGAFGPEASAYSVLAGLVVTAAFLWLAKRRDNIVPRRGRAASAATLAA